MKILWLYRNLERWGYNHWYHGDFMKVVNTLPELEVKFYGLGVEEIYPDMIVCPYNSKLNINNIKNIFDFDIIIIWNKSRQDFIPSGINKITTPKILIEGDYFKFRRNPWFENMKIDLILHRHKTNVIRGTEDFPYIPQLWFPCSVDTNIFKPKNLQRIPRIGFIGSQASPYPYRVVAKKILSKYDLVSYLGKNYDQRYIDILQQYVGYLNCSSIYSIDNAKAFEIMASGGILLTNQCDNGYMDLFGKDTFVTYKNDGSDLIKNTKQILYDENFREIITTNALKIILEKHTHLKRAKELIQIICDEFELKEIFFLDEKKDWLKNLKDILFKDLKKETFEKIITNKEPLLKKNFKEEEKLNILKDLISKNIRVCLLKNTCYEAVVEKKVESYLCIGISGKNIESIKTNLNNLGIIIEEFPAKTKFINYGGLKVEIPFPVIKYLTNLYEKDIHDLLNKQKQ